jgi:streptogramin lyase
MNKSNNYNQILADCFDKNREAVFQRVEVYGNFAPNTYKFAGAVYNGKYFICIPNSGTEIAMIDPEFERRGGKPFTLFNGDFEAEQFGYTGGVLYNEKVYALPRRANAVLEIDPERKTAVRIPLCVRYDYPDPQVFHHYAGVIFGDNVYCAPKKSRNILVINLAAISTRADVNSRELSVPDIGNQSYQGGVPHPNGLIYFNPTTQCRVMVLDPQTEETEFIGSPSPQFIFKSIVLPDGKIYGFGYDGGMLITDPADKSTRFIGIAPANPGTYGTIVGFNGKIYSGIGSGTALLEFDPSEETFRVKQAIDDGKHNYAKCAAFGLATDGSIWQMPAVGRFIYRIVFNGIKSTLPPEFLKQPVFSGY